MIRGDYVETVRERVVERDIECTDQHIVECLKYLAIMSGTTGRRIVVTPDVDEVWHELIVQTRLYRALCSSFPGARFIDHESITPEAYAERVGDATFVDEFLQWVPDYVQSFGPFTEERAKHWTVVDFLRTEMGLSLQEINDAGMASEATAAIPVASPWRRLREDRLDAITASA